MRCKTVLTALFGLVLIGGSASAAEIKALPEDDGKALIVVDGQLESGDEAKFQNAVAPFSKAGVLLSGPGGNVGAALQIGTTIRMKNFFTVVPDGVRCASACALIWLAGSNRYMGANALIGFHAAYMLGDDGQPIESGVGNALIGAYLNRLGLPDKAIAYITEAHPTGITWLSLASAQTYGIDVSPVPVSTVATAKPTPPAQPAVVAQKIGPSYDCTKADTDVTRLICVNPALSKADLEYVQPYYVLRAVVGQPGWKPLLVEAVDFQQNTLFACGSDAAGDLPQDVTAFSVCLLQAYQKQRMILMARLTGAGLEEAMRPIEQHIALQSRLQQLGFLPATEKIDGVYGTVTRNAIMQWQISVGSNPTGLLGDADAARLMNTATTAAVALADNATVTRIASKLKLNLKNGGIASVPEMVNACYAQATGVPAIRECLLYDSAAYMIYEQARKYFTSRGVKVLDLPFFSHDAFNARTAPYLQTAFGGFNDEAKHYLSATMEIAKEALQ